MVSINTLTNGDVVKSASIPETMAAAALGGIANGFISSALPNVNPLITSIGMVVGGVVAGGVIKGKAGDVVQNALTITGAVKLSDYAVAMISGALGGATQTGQAESSDMSVIY